MNKVYKWAGIGARSTPSFVLDNMTLMSQHLSEQGHMLRTGGAAGADSAFMAGATEGNAEIFLPWASYKVSGYMYNPWPTTWKVYATVTPDATLLAAKYHPAWDKCSRSARALHGRNSYIILGYHLDDPVDFVICWTAGGKAGGGTGQALRIAQDRGIPVLDFGVYQDSADIQKAYSIFMGSLDS